MKSFKTWQVNCLGFGRSKVHEMKIAGWILLLAGISMIIIRGMETPHSQDIRYEGPVQIHNYWNDWIGWPTYAGGAIAIVGIVVLASGKKK